MLLGGLDERLRLPLKSLETQVPIRFRVALGQDADFNITGHSAILAEDGALTRLVDSGRFFLLAIRFLFAYQRN